MELSVLERIVLIGMLPKEGSFSNLKLLRKVKEDLSFTDEENKKLNFRPGGEGTVWNSTVGETEIHIGEVVKSLIIKALKQLDTDQKLTSEHYTIFEKFIIAEQS